MSSLSRPWHPDGIFDGFSDGIFDMLSPEEQAEELAYQRIECDPFNGTYVLCWRYFADAPDRKKWQAFFNDGNNRYAAIPAENSAIPSQPNSFTLCSLLRSDVGNKRRSGITEISVMLESELPINEKFGKLPFHKEYSPKLGKYEWCATISRGTTIKIVLDRNAKIEPLEDGLKYAWKPVAILHRSKNGRFILISAELDITAEEREQEIQDLKTRQEREAEALRIKNEERARIATRIAAESR